MRLGVVFIISALIVMALHVDQSEGKARRRGRGGTVKKVRYQNNVRTPAGRPGRYGQVHYRPRVRWQGFNRQYRPRGRLQGYNQQHWPRGGRQGGNQQYGPSGVPGCPYQDPAGQDDSALPREFSDYDENSDGKISREEFKRVLAAQDKMAAADQANNQGLVEGEKRLG